MEPEHKAYLLICHKGYSHSGLHVEKGDFRWDHKSNRAFNPDVWRVATEKECVGAKPKTSFKCEGAIWDGY